jgi:hypothetical protein
MRVFISSTAYDLLDARAELASMLRSIGITPVLSDDKLSAFEVQPDMNSIETCLVNLRSCDETIVLLDRRYGRSLSSRGFDDVSATHLEYRTAKDAEKPIRFFVRDRTAGEWSTWKKNNRPETMKFMWVSKPEDHRLFEMLDEHEKLQVTSATSNWYDTFTTSMDLKAAVAKYFRPRILPQQLTKAIDLNVFPLLDLRLNEPRMTRKATSETPPVYVMNFDVVNIGGAPAFNFTLTLANNNLSTAEYGEILPPKHTFPCSIYFEPNKPNAEQLYELEASCTTPMGVAVEYKFVISMRFDRGIVPVNYRQVSRQFKKCDPVNIQIQD